MLIILLGIQTIEVMFDSHTYLTKISGAWQSTPIILRQVSPESPKIFALIKELYQCCNGNWNLFVDRGLLGSNTSEMGESLQQFLWYAATFLSNMGNYFVRFLS